MTSVFVNILIRACCNLFKINRFYRIQQPLIIIAMLICKIGDRFQSNILDQQECYLLCLDHVELAIGEVGQA